MDPRLGSRVCGLGIEVSGLNPRLGFGVGLVPGWGLGFGA